MNGKDFPEEFDRIDKFKSADKILINDSSDGVNKYATLGQFNAPLKELELHYGKAEAERVKAEKSRVTAEEQRQADTAKAVKAANDATSRLLGEYLKGRIYAGMATPESVPHATDDNVFYIAKKAGNYINFGNLTIAEKEVAIIYPTNQVWEKQTIYLSTLNLKNGSGSISVVLDNFNEARSESVAFGYRNKAYGYQSFVMGETCTTSGSRSFCGGLNSASNGHGSYAMGNLAKADGEFSHAEGSDAKAIGDISHSEGYITEARGKYSHAEGKETVAQNDCTHAEGNSTVASGKFAHAEGNGCQAKGGASHAEGVRTQTSAEGAHSGGIDTVANTRGGFVHGINVRGTGLSEDEAQVIMGRDFNAGLIKRNIKFAIGGADKDNNIPWLEYYPDNLEFYRNGKVVNIGKELEALDAKTKNLIAITYSELVALRDAESLVPGRMYRITDYDCTTTETDTQSAHHAFDVIVTADDASTLNENARAIRHEGDTYFATSHLAAWELKYCLDNDSNRFRWADAENGKGVIYFMRDEWGNECPYDFKNIQFWPDTSQLDYGDGGFFAYTFNWYTADGECWDLSIKGNDGTLPNDENAVQGVHGNIVKPYWNYSTSSDPETPHCQWLNGNVFLSHEEYDYGCCYGYSYNTFDFGCRLNIIEDDCHRNSFGSACWGNIIGDSSSYNVFMAFCYQNLLRGNNYNNVFKFDNWSNVLETHSNNNSFDCQCRYNYLGGNCSANHFACGCYNNKVGNYVRGCTFGEECNRNVFGTDETALIGYCENIILGNKVENCKIYGESTPTSETPLRYIRIASGLEKQNISVPTGLASEISVGLNSAGELVKKNPFD